MFDVEDECIEGVTSICAKLRVSREKPGEPCWGLSSFMQERELKRARNRSVPGWATMGRNEKMRVRIAFQRRPVDSASPASLN
jgi:hypothetical protein